MIGWTLACSGADPVPPGPPAPGGDPPDIARIREDDPYGPVSYWYKQLEAGCTEERWVAHGVQWPPDVARLIRNTPYALRGRSFASPDLRTFFDAQPWYQPRPDAPPPPPEEVECAKRIAAWEEARRRAHPIPPEFEERLRRDRYFELYLVPRDRGWPPPGEPFRHDGGWYWCVQAAAPDGVDTPCWPSVGVHCPEDRECTWSTGG